MASVTRRLFLDRSPGEARGVVVLDGRPERLIIERDDDQDRPRVGEIWRGRIGASAPGFRGSFIELGAGPAGLLAAEAGARPPEGAIIDVEIMAEARADKGPVVRRHGPGEGAPGRQVRSESLESRLQNLLPGAEIIQGREARETADLAQEEALATVHALSGGLNLSVEPTRGMTAIDVDFSRADAGSRATLEANLRAIREAARLLRLKGQGGLIVIDLIGQASQHREILDGAKSAFEDDQPGIVLAGVSRLGVLQLARPWRETPIRERLVDEAGNATLPTLARQLVRDLEQAGRDDPGGQFVVECGSELAIHLTPLVMELGPRFGTVSHPGKTARDCHIRPR